VARSSFKFDAGKEILLKVQSVEVIPLTIGPAGELTIGQQIDAALSRIAIDNRQPTKLVLDLNPPRVDATADFT